MWSRKKAHQAQILLSLERVRVWVSQQGQEGRYYLMILELEIDDDDDEVFG